MAHLRTPSRPPCLCSTLGTATTCCTAVTPPSPSLGKKHASSASLNLATQNLCASIRLCSPQSRLRSLGTLSSMPFHVPRQTSPRTTWTRKKSWPCILCGFLLHRPLLPLLDAKHTEFTSFFEHGMFSLPSLPLSACPYPNLALVSAMWRSSATYGDLCVLACTWWYIDGLSCVLAPKGHWYWIDGMHCDTVLPPCTTSPWHATQAS